MSGKPARRMAGGRAAVSVLQPELSEATQGVSARKPLKVAYLFTTFPKLSETFLQREVHAMRQLSVDLELHSLWGGGAHFAGLTVQRFSKLKLISLLWLLPYWLVRKPSAFADLIKDTLNRSMPSWKNCGETFIGISFAITHAARFNKHGRRPDLIHGVWATMPATAAQLLAKLTGIPFSMGAHAYDLFQDGGDWLLPSKLRDTALVVTSTEMAREELLSRGAKSEKVVVIRRGLFPFPQFSEPRALRSPLRVLCVARLVEKKGICGLLEIFAEMVHRKIPFEARLVGGGPLEKDLRHLADNLELSRDVRFLGRISHSDVLEQYAWADVFVFNGTVAKDGDRDGFPNVILEAMATGTPVVAGISKGISELIEDGCNGVLISEPGPGKWISALVRLRDDDVYYRRLSRQGRLTVESNNDARVTANALLARFGQVSGK